MRATLTLAVVVTGCRIAPQAPRPAGPWFDGAPVVEGLSLTCDQDAARWILQSEVDAWSGGGELLITADGEVVERHTVRATESAGDGTWDCLALSLGQAADPADAAPGASSRWLCREEAELSFLFVVADTDNAAWTDCVAWGARPGVWATVEGAPACDATAQADEDGLVYDGFESCG